MTDLDDFCEMVTAYKKMPGHGTGGPLHIVLDDLNVEAHHITWCVEEWLPEHPCSEMNRDGRVWAHESDCTPETTALADVLLSLSEDTREAWLNEWWSR